MQHKKTEVERIRCIWPLIIKKYQLYTKKKLLYFSIIHKWVTQWVGSAVFTLDAFLEQDPKEIKFMKKPYAINESLEVI